MARKHNISDSSWYPHHHVRRHGPNHAVEARRRRRTTSLFLAAPPLMLVCATMMVFGAFGLWPDSAEKVEKPLQSAKSAPKLNSELNRPAAVEVPLPGLTPERQPQLPAPQPVQVEIPKKKKEPIAPEPPRIPPPPQVPELPPVAIPVEPVPPIPNIVEIPSAPAPPPKPELVEIPAPKLEPIAKKKPKVQVKVVAYEMPHVFTYHDELRGDSPMKQTWNILLTVALASTPVAATAQQKDLATKADISKVLKKLALIEQQNKDIKQLKKDVGAINQNIEKIKTDFAILKGNDLKLNLDIGDVKKNVAGLEKKLAKLELDLKLLKDLIPDSPSPATADLSEIKSRLGKIETAILQLQSKSQKVHSSPSPVGRIVIINQYGEELLVVIGTEKFRVGPGRSQIIEAVPAGALQYEVISPTLGVVGRRNSSLGEKETIQITIR